jgi:hypothetical protein
MFCAAEANQQLWMRNKGVFGLGFASKKTVVNVPVICASSELCLIGDVQDGHRGLAANGASWTDAQIPGPADDLPFLAGDCTRHFCMLLVGDGYGSTQETHARV